MAETLTARERAVAAATVFNAHNPGHFPGRPLFEGLVESAIRDAEAAMKERGKALALAEARNARGRGSDAGGCACENVADAIAALD